MIPLPPACDGCPARPHALGFVPPSGDENAPTLLIGQGPGLKNEVPGGAPFIGAAGQRLTRWCIKSGFPKRKARICNIVQCGLPKDRAPKPSEVAFCREAHWGRELKGQRVTIAIGVPAMKALMGPECGIQDAGRWMEFGAGYIMGLVHPSAIIRGLWGQDPFQIAHLRRARAVLDGAEPNILDCSVPAPKTNMWPTLGELREWEGRLGPEGLALDVEAAGNALRLVGLRGIEDREGVEVGFRGDNAEPWVWCPVCRGLDPTCAHPQDDFNEVVWWLARLLADESIPKTMQNGQAYDIPEQLENVGFVVRGFRWDTLLMAHIRQPEMPKGLEALSAAFLGLSGWKSLSKLEEEGDLK